MKTQIFAAPAVKELSQLTYRLKGRICHLFKLQIHDYIILTVRDEFFNEHMKI